MTAREALSRSCLKAARLLTPPPKLTVSQWADTERRLSSLDSAEPGQWSTARAEYLRGVMDGYNEPDIEDVVFMASAQVGKTQGGINNTLGYIIDQDPGPIMIVMPTQDDCKEWSKDRFMEGLIAVTPCLRGKVSEVRTKNSKDTIEHKRFPGGQLTIAWSNSPSRLASRPIRNVFFDEVDKYQLKPGVQGNPVDRGKARTRTFWNRKHFYYSTPTLGEISLIDRLYLQSDMRRFHVPCPHCGERGVIAMFGDMPHPAVKDAQFHVAWPRAADGTHLCDEAYLVCHKCGGVVEEKHKQGMVSAGEWKAENPGGKIAGFHISELYSTLGNSTWGSIAKRFLDARKDLDALQSFYNETLGLPWELQGETVREDLMAKRIERYAAPVPAGVIVLTAAADIQSDRIEAEVRGWGHREESWAIEKRVFRGDPAILSGQTGNPSVWEQLDQFLATRFEHESGVTLPIFATMIDSGGHHTQQVYQFCARRWGRRIFACKGAAGIRPIASPPKVVAGGARLVTVGVDTAKETIYRRLWVDEVGPGYCHFPERPEYDAEHFKQLASEKLVIENKKFRPRKVWVKTRPRNEALDLFVYSLAALELNRVNFNAAQKNLAEKAKREQAPPAVEEVILGAPPQPQPRMQRRAIRHSNPWVENW